MKNIVFLAAFTLLCSTSYGKPIPGMNDYGVLLDANKFENKCAPIFVGQDIINIYTHKQISCRDVGSLFSTTQYQIDNFIEKSLHKNVNKTPPKIITIRILTLAELNDPDNFSQTNSKCMQNYKCETGAYFGRTFYSNTSDYINIYVVFGNYNGKYLQYSFVPTFKHELMHAILNKYGLNHSLSEKEEHKVISKFLEWAQTASDQ